MKRRLFIIILSITIIFTFSSSSFASGWLDSVEDIKLDTTYEGYASDNYEGWAFTLPAKGTIKVRIESEYRGTVGYTNFEFFKKSDPDTCIYRDYCANGSIGYEPYYSSARDVYYGYFELELPKGSYYVATFSDYWSADGPFEFSLNYKPKLASTKIIKLTPKKKAFTVKYKKAGYATGYEIKYSLKKSMKSAKKVKTTRLYKTVKNLKKGKKYYVKVRTYRKLRVDGVMKTYYSKWSTRKSVTTK